MLTEQEKFMKEAIRQAKKARALEEVPIGCVIVSEGKIIARGYNRRNTDKNTLSHAELNAIRKASRKLGDWRLEGCTMYVTLEPCQMCAGALVQSRIDEVVIGSNEDLMTDTLYGDHVNLMSVSSIEDGMRFQAKVRYNHRGALCTVSMDGNDRIKVLFDEPQRAVTPGQAVVFYAGDYVAGGATIL